MKLKQFLTEFFTWWNGQTFGTRLTIRRHGEFVGEDAFGNKYYRDRRGKIDGYGYERRYVIYNGLADASRTPMEWRMWLCHTYPTPPSEEDYTPRAWQKPHEENLTGTPRAYRPRGSTLSEGQRPAATGDYVAWSPGD